MTEASIIFTKIDLLRECKELISREIDFKIAMLEAKLKISPTHTGDITGPESPFKIQRQKPRATNFDYKNEVEAGGIVPETV